MHNNRLGCFTGAGIIATLITLFAIVGIAFASGSQMFSAGGLNAQPGDAMGGVTSHAQITECSACHAAPIGADTMADRCASCHTNIAAQMKDVAKLHGAIMQKSSTLACRDCHPEHRGASASLTDMGENRFPHEALGFSLKGHRLTAAKEAFTCKDCHQADITKFTPDTCDSCHRQMDVAFTQSHVLAFGADCLACHDGVDKFGSDFKHSAFAFPLNGKHVDVACSKCHLDTRSVADLQSAPQDCYSCHQKDDKHDGQFGKDCAVCHNPSSWTDAKFDHNLSAFKLEGGHAEVKCEQCHVNNVFKGTPQDCYSCHQKDDEHNGKFGTDCAACHTQMAGMAQHLTTAAQPSNWKVRMSVLSVKSVIKIMYSRVRLQPVAPVMLTQPSTREHLEQIAPHAIILPIGIRQDLMCHIQNQELKMVEAVSITAGLLAASAIHPLCNSLLVQPVMKVILVVAISKDITPRFFKCTGKPQVMSLRLLF